MHPRRHLYSPTPPTHLSTPSMNTRTITLTRDQQEFVEEQARATGFESAADYLLDLIDQERDRIRLQTMIIDGIRSGEPTVVEPDDYLDVGKLIEELSKNWASGSIKP